MSAADKAPNLCHYCDRQGFYDPEEDEAMEPLVLCTLDGDSALFHPSCFREMVDQGPCCDT